MSLCRYILLNDNLSDLYAIAIGTSTYLIGLDYTGFASKEVEKHSKKKRTRKLSSIICMSERQC